MMGIKVCSRDTEGGIWRLRWVSRYSYMRHSQVIQNAENNTTTTTSSKGVTIKGPACKIFMEARLCLAHCRLGFRKKWQHKRAANEEQET